MRFFDLSQPLFDDCPNCHVHPPVRLPVTADHPADGWRMEEFHMASHTGTHLDAPLHKIAGGASIDRFPLETFAGEQTIIDLTDLPPGHPIGPAELERAGEVSGRILLLNTGWGHKRAKTDEWIHHSPYLSPAGAEWIVEKGGLAVGIDHFSIGGTGPDNTPTHEVLLGNNVWVIEDLCFREGWRDFADGATFMALPLLVPGFSGSPCRAVLVKDPAAQPVREFIDAFEEVFDRDWAYAKEMMGVQAETESQKQAAAEAGLESIPMIAEDCTFLNPGVEDEIENWGHRGALLAAYRKLKESMR